MSKCEATLNGALTAQTSTGPTTSKVICRIGKRNDIKQFVWVRNRRAYPSEISVESSITSNQRFVHFEIDPDCPPADVRRASWRGTCYLASDEEYMFCVSLVSDNANDNPQDIEVNIDSETASGVSKSPPMNITVLA